MRGVIASLLLAMLLGCASAPPPVPPLRATPEADQAAKRFRSKPGVARVYLYRNTRFGADALMSLRIDNVDLGTMGGASFMPLELSPGFHQLEVNGTSVSKLELNLQGGRNYFIQVNNAVTLEIGKIELIERHALEAQYAIENDCSMVQPRQFALVP
ncbi:DUF2846 domain-containing protein [Uliginosibacterium sp. 31-12]|uniref:DUF2846 domain-containing protein n=1 Tax=Uliginosibacterium sp. 31-12 TaxID=3062781 RepID=UPI0026E29EE8|nr:DUF2846 domain-containing protein [Uliginosibacterium sp. 31-12]MDO6387480.1 DUF2846 domain-containing protein [Uliginosibacterium sp. 31-12]